MIDIRFPHMGINDPRSPVFCRMWNTWNISQTERKTFIFDWAARVARGAPGGRLAELVICCHGRPGFLQLGEGIGSGDAHLFGRWRDLVGKVWIRACLVGRIVTPQSLQEGDGALLQALNLSGDGHRFCSEAARALGGYIVVSTELQVSSRYSRTNPLPYGRLDAFEGLVLSYHPDGTVGWSQSYPSVFNINVAAMRVRNPNRE